MGSFTVACFASHQVIADHDPCRVIAIQQNRTFTPVAMRFGNEVEKQYGAAESTCYPNAFWDPVTGFIPATYADYGRVTLELTDLSRSQLLTFFSDIQHRCPVIEQGENPVHDVPFDFETFLVEKAPKVAAVLGPKTRFGGDVFHGDASLDEEIRMCWDYIFEVAQEHRLFIRKSGSSARPLQFAIIHESAYQQLIASLSQRNHWDGQSLAPSAVIQRALADARETVVTFFSKEEHNDPRIQCYGFSNKLTDILGRFNPDRCLPARALESVIQHHAVALLKGILSDDEAVALLQPYLLDSYAVTELGNLNLMFAPIAYSGQDYSNETGLRYAEFVRTVSKAVSRQCKVRQYGDYSPYVMYVRSEEDFKRFVQAMQDGDSDVDDIEVLSDREAAPILMGFTAPHDLDVVREIIAAMDDPQLMPDTLSERRIEGQA